MTSSVFIKTQLEDLGFLEWCLKFLAKNWNTDSQFVICAPNDCSESLKALESTLGKPISLAPMDQWPEHGYTHQQYMKHHADLYCSGDLITFIDSDAMLVLPTTVENLMLDGKPILWFTEYKRLDAPWQFMVGQILSLTPEHEFMRCFPFTYHRDTLKACREHVEEMQSRPLADVMHAAPTWTEFNVIGFYAYVFERARYTWKHTDFMYSPEGLANHWHDRVHQFHRIYDWNDVTRERMEIMLNGQADGQTDREPDRADEGGMVGPQGGPISRPRKKRATTGRRRRVPKSDLQTHNTGISSD